MFEDDVTVPAGWYPDPMVSPSCAGGTITPGPSSLLEAHPPLVVHTSTRLAFADDEVPTRRQQREQRERDEEYATSPPTKTKRRMPPPRTPLSVTCARSTPRAMLDEDRAADEPHDEIDDIDDIDDDAVDPGDPRS
jgi:hypothetical protein